MNIEFPSLILINGMQGMGKSHLIRYIMSKYKKEFDYGIVFTNTFFDENPFDYIPPEYVHPEYNEGILVKLMDKQADLVGRGVKKSCFVIFDDCIDDEGQWSSKPLKRLTTQLRHYNITVIISTQYVNAIPSRIRTNAMYCIMFKSDTMNNTKALYESYGQKFDTFNEFKKYLMDNTGDYKFLFYDKMNDSEDVSERYISMKAPEKVRKFRVEYNLGIKKM